MKTYEITTQLPKFNTELKLFHSPPLLNFFHPEKNCYVYKYYIHKFQRVSPVRLVQQEQSHAEHLKVKFIVA